MRIHLKRYALLFVLVILTGCGGFAKSTAVNNHHATAQSSLSPEQSQVGLTSGYFHDNPYLILSVDDPAVEHANASQQVAAENGAKSENGEVHDNQALINAALDFYNSSQQYWSEDDPDSAIKALDQAYMYTLQVDADDRPELIQQKEDLRFMISKRILEIYASRHTAVNGSHNAIPLTLNSYVEAEIKRFQGAERKSFLNAYRRSGKYRQDIVKALKEAGLPEELSWLPVIESSFKVNALSRARALGLWQFIPSTGYKYGLKRDTWVDERLDPAKATAAAIAYMKELHSIFGDWTTVLAAYNCGEGTVLKRIRSQKVNYLDNFWDLYEKLPMETARYVPRFLAVLHILEDPDRYGFTFDEPETPMPYETVDIKKQVRLRDVAKALECSTNELRQLNPELRRQITPDRQYTLKVPPGKGEVLLAKLDKVPKWSMPKTSYVYHRVRRGETLSLIALKYHTSMNSIARANHIRRKHLIRAGQLLKIPTRNYASHYSIPADGKYRVRKGDSLWLIARKFNTSTKTLKKINNLRSITLYVGQILRVR
jgi:membrane-bound lytic murein transglycosylase D